MKKRIEKLLVIICISGLISSSLCPPLVIMADTVSPVETETNSDITPTPEVDTEDDSDEIKEEIDTETEVDNTVEVIEDNTNTPTLQEKSVITSLPPEIRYQSHIQDIGWQAIVNEGEMSGTINRGKRLEAMRIYFKNNGVDGSIEYQTHVQNIGWQNWVRNSSLTGTSGMGLRMEAIRLRLTGQLSNEYDIYYRVHVQNFGWLDWAKNGEEAGSAGYSYRMEAIEIKLIKKGETNNLVTTNPYQQKDLELQYRSYVQNNGWVNYSSNGKLSGTTGKSLRMEALQIHLYNAFDKGGIEYQTHIQNIGWQNWVGNGKVSGTTGQALRVEALRVRLTGQIANEYDIYYRVHVQNVGWLGWAKNGATAGTMGYSYKIEAVEIKIEKKSDYADTAVSYLQKELDTYYYIYIKGVGWTLQKRTGEMFNTSSKGYLVEGLKIGLYNKFEDSGTIEYQGHVQNVGWQNWSSELSVAGTPGKNQRLEAVRIRLTGDLALKYDIYYRVYVEKHGWLDWAKNGESAGSNGMEYRMEDIQIIVVNKGEESPGNTTNPFYEKKVLDENEYINVNYSTYHTVVGWTSVVSNGDTSGSTTAEDKIESLKINIDNNSKITGGIEYQAHVQDTGWLNWIENGNTSGISGSNKRIEAIRIRLTGELAEYYDVYYRSYIESYGWLAWTKNGENSGSSGVYYRTDAIEVKLVLKGTNGPSTSGKAYVTGGWKTVNGYTYYYRDGVALNDWAWIDSKKYFFNAYGHLIAKDAKFIIDVSTHQGVIDWDAVKRQGVIDGVILRIGYNDVGLDAQFERNLSEVRRLGIPYGVYLYSYAENGTEAVMEANFMITLLNRYNVKDQTLGIYYDVEHYALGKTIYDSVIPSFINKLNNAGYTSKVYSGKNFAENNFSDNVKKYLTWIAQYNHYCNYSGTYNMWQYGGEPISGIVGNVDANVMSNNFVKY